MAHLKPLFCTPVSGSVSYEHAVVVSDSAMDLPGAMYGHACLLRAPKLNLLRLVSKPGAGAKELAAVWGKAPRCVFGLTVYNLNGAARVSLWVVTADIRRDINVLLQVAMQKCSEKHEGFVHQASSRLASARLSRARARRL